MARRAAVGGARTVAAIVAAVALVLGVSVTAQAAGRPFVGGVTRAAPGSSVARDELFFYDAGRYTYIDTGPRGEHVSTARSGRYLTGYQSIVPADLDGDRQDEMIFHTSSGVWSAYDVGVGAALTGLLSRTTVSSRFEQVAAVDLEGDQRDEMVLYDVQTGRFEFRRLSADGSLGALIRSGTWVGRWTSVVPVDIGGDQRDELLLYRAGDGHAEYWDLSSATAEMSLIRTTTYGRGWTHVTAVDVDADVADELHFYNRSTRAVKFYDLDRSTLLGPLLRSDRYRSSWAVVAAGNVDPMGSTRLTQLMLTAVNARRQDAGLAPVELLTGLNHEAQRWSIEQAADGVTSHRANPATGVPPLWHSVGENVASGQPSVADVMDAWMADEEARATLLDPAFTHLGVGLAYDLDGTPYWTQVLAEY